MPQINGQNNCLLSSILIKLKCYSYQIQPTQLNLIYYSMTICSGKHLGVTLASDCKWTAHKDSIYLSCMKKICVLRTLKYVLNRQTLVKICKCFIRPVLEYASEVWDGCSQYDKQRLKSIQ